MKNRIFVAFILLIQFSIKINAAYDSWFTVTGHPDGRAHTAYVLHDNSWPSSGGASFINPPGVQAVYVDGFLPEQAGWAQEIMEMAFAVAVSKEALNESFPQYIITNNTGASPIRIDQWARETRADDQGQQFTSYYLKHCTVMGWQWYDYDALRNYEDRKSKYFAAFWQIATQPARDTASLDDIKRLSELKQQIGWASATWKYAGKPVLDWRLDAYFTALANNSAITASSADQYLQDIVNNSVQASQIKTAFSDVSLFLSILSAGGQLASSFQIGLLYDRIVVMPQVGERISCIEAAVSSSPSYDPAMVAAVSDLRDVYNALCAKTGNDLIGWLEQRLEYLQLLKQTDPDKYDGLVRSGVKLIASGAQFYSTVIAGVSLSPVASAAILGGYVVWDNVQGLFDEWNKMNMAAIYMNVNEVLKHKNQVDIASVSLSTIDYTLAKHVCSLSSLNSYSAYMFHELMADVAIDPDAGLFYLLKLFVVGLTRDSATEYRDSALAYSARILALPGDVDMRNNRDFLYQSAGGAGWPVSSYASAKTFLLNKMVWDRPRTSPSAVIQSITPTSITRGSGTLVFNGSTSSATTPSTTLTAYRWNSSIDGQLYSGANSSFSRDSTTLSAGQHTISLQVQDSNGLWSDNTAQATLYVYAAGPDKGHDLAVNRIDLDKTVIAVNGTVRTDVFIENQGTNAESGFAILYKLLNSSGGVLDQKTNYPAGTWNPGQNSGPGYVYLTSIGGYSGAANIEVTVQNTLDEDRSDNTRTSGIYVGTPPTYDGYVGGSWTYIYGTGDATESGYALALLNDYGGSVRISITKGSTWTATMSPDQFNFFDANKFAVLYIGKQSGTPTKYGFGMFVNNTNQAWLAQKIVVGDEGGTGVFTNKRASSTSTACDDWYISASGQGSTVAGWNPQGQKVDDYTYRVTVSPPLNTAGYYEFWFDNCVGFGLSPTVTTRTGPAMAMRAAITVNEDREPETAITSCPTGTISTRTVTAQFAGSDDRTPTTNMTYAYRLTGYQDSWSSYSLVTSVTYSNLTNGVCSFEVKAKDNQGQIDSSPAQCTFTVNVQIPPGTPNNVSPSQNGILRPTQPFTLQASAFSDPDPGSSQLAAIFQIRNDSGDYNTPVWTNGTLGVSTSCVVPLGALPGGKIYWWRCIYRDNTGLWSDFSGETSFTLQTNHSPVANASSIEVTHDKTATIQLSVSDEDGDSLSCQAINQPSHGSIITNTPTSISYTPNAHYLGADSITYKASDGLSLSSTQTVTISVVNHAPIANNILAVMGSGERTTIALPVSDSDADALSYSITANPAHGTLFTNNLTNGIVDYQSETGFNDTDSISYSASDGLASCTGTITLMVSDPNDITVDILLDNIKRAIVQYPTVTGRTYKVQYSDTMLGPWSNLFSGAMGDGTLKETTDTNQTLPKARFYRVSVMPP